MSDSMLNNMLQVLCMNMFKNMLQVLHKITENVTFHSITTGKHKYHRIYCRVVIDCPKCVLLSCNTLYTCKTDKLINLWETQFSTLISDG